MVHSQDNLLIVSEFRNFRNFFRLSSNVLPSLVKVSCVKHASEKISVFCKYFAAELTLGAMGNIQ